jgi:hypothetical protein
MFDISDSDGDTYFVMLTMRTAMMTRKTKAISSIVMVKTVNLPKMKGYQKLLIGHPTNNAAVTIVSTACLDLSSSESRWGNIPDLKKAREEVAQVVRSKFSKALFIREDMFDFSLQRAVNPMRGIFTASFLVNVSTEGDDNKWWDAVRRSSKQIHPAYNRDHGYEESIC